ncbi:unnamed protein product [Medioppia subpectinata]|uniref:Uncharacterized protein n=1 Tax=Medioppia subpectinata TaxID=1979941 RepID=A0A7R9LMG8_9ACAR|nr:unnamed protein product [Medioppia subpectinata]CAG2120096.1 unnamed protein product [Medioppia subpectinata]
MVMGMENIRELRVLAVRPLLTMNKVSKPFLSTEPSVKTFSISTDTFSYVTNFSLDFNRSSDPIRMRSRT